MANLCEYVLVSAVS